MKKKLFAELVESIREAGKIHRGERAASRKFGFKPEDVRAIRKKSRILAAAAQSGAGRSVK
jgi:putative transcriptional regulator